MKNSFSLPGTHSFDQILSSAQTKVKQSKPKAALLIASEIDTLKAFAEAVKKNLIDPVVIGDEKLALRKAEETGLDITSYEFIDINEPDMAVLAAIKMAAAKELDFIVKGRYPTSDLINILLNIENGFYHKKSILSHITVIKTELYEKLLFITDSFANVEYNLNTKLGIINNAVKFAVQIGINQPAVAMLSAVEAVSPQMPVTTDAAIISKMAERNQIKNACVDGPLSFDIAVDKEAALGKGITESKVAGQADILVASDMATANGIVKAMTLFTKSEYGGVLTGGLVPVTFCCPYDSVECRFNSILLGILAI